MAVFAAIAFVLIRNKRTSLQMKPAVRQGSHLDIHRGDPNMNLMGPNSTFSLNPVFRKEYA
jgi:hypothetical protein